MKSKETDLLRRVRQIEIVSRKVVDELLGGEYKSVFKGRGMEFDEVREYQPGDEVRTIDWNVTARTGKPFVKRFVEEREQVIVLLVDLSASGAFGSAGKTKNEIAAELCGLLAFSAIKNNDKVGLLLFTDRVELFIPPEKGQLHVLRIIRELLGFEPVGTGTCIACAIDHLGKMVKRKCIAFLVSDFQDSDCEKSLRLAAHHYDLIAATITDPRELELPNIGMVELRDAETGERLLVDTASAAARERFNTTARKRHQAMKEQLAHLGIDQIDVHTDRDYLRDLVAFFRARELRQTL